MVALHGPGEKKFRTNPSAFGREQWDSWSPAGWYTEEEFHEAAASWTNEDFGDVVVHSYRSRWGHAQSDPEYADLQDRFLSTKTLNTPTLLIHGEADQCELLQTTDGADRHFTDHYRRAVLKDVGHFPQREAPKHCAEAILNHIVQFQ